MKRIFVSNDFRFLKEHRLFRFCPFVFLILEACRGGMNMEHWWDDSDRGKTTEICPCVTLSTTPLTQRDINLKYI